MAAKSKAKASYSVLRQSVNEFLEDDCMSSAAALAYYSIFSLPPILAIIIFLTGYLGAGGSFGANVQDQISQFLGSEESFAQIQQAADSAKKKDSNIAATVIGVIVLVFSATGVLAQLQYSLNRAWEVEPDPEAGGIKKFFLKRALSFGMILAFAFLLLLSTMLSMLLNSAGQTISSALSLPVSLTVAVPYAVNFVVVTLLFAAIFKILPDARLGWRSVGVGALFTALLFMVGKEVMSFYISRADVGSGFDQAAKALVAVLLWFYYSSIIVLFGAEFTQVWARRYGTRIHPSNGAVRTVNEKRHLRTESEQRQHDMQSAASA